MFLSSLVGFFGWMRLFERSEETRKFSFNGWKKCVCVLLYAYGFGFAMLLFLSSLVDGFGWMRLFAKLRKASEEEMNCVCAFPRVWFWLSKL